MPIRVHELAKELKISTMALKKHLTDLGVITKSHMSLIEDDVANKIRLKYNEQIDAEKKAERDRKKLIEMRHAAKAKPEPDLVIPQEAIVEPETESKTEARPEPEPEPKPEPKEPEMAISQAQETPPTPAAPIKVPEKEDKPASIRQPQAERAKTLSYFDTQRKPQDSRTRTQAPTDRRPDYKKKPTEYRKPEVPIDQAAKKLAAVPVDSAKEVDKKFGKAKSTPDDLGDKSKHKKALIGGTKKSKRKVAEPAEVDEAEISRSIKKTLQKSTKKKKYHREAQVVQERINEIVIREYTSVSELAKIMNVSPSEIISKFFMLGQLVTMNQRLDRDSLEMICDEFKLDFRFEDEYGTELLERDKDSYEDVEEELRPPVVTIMGHVDHGKTSILDYIRNTNVVAGESGGITQHIGAYQIEINKHKITFLDTPGHEAFSAMRARGANVTDIAVIVVAATEGMKPQTKEAIDHAKAAGVSIIIAITKVDLPDSNIDRVIAQLLEYGVFLEQYGGEIPWCKTSVVTGEGVLNLIELIILTAELKELTAKASVPATGTVVESQKDPRKGVVVTILIKEGCLKKGDTVVCGATYGRIKKMENERGMEIKELGPSDVAIIYGLDNVPKAGDTINVVDSEKTARSIATERQQVRFEREKYQNKASLQNIFARMVEDQMNELKIILKTDTDGSAEAIADSFQKLSNNEVTVNILHKSVGGINEADINLASASDAIVIGFNVRPNQLARKLAEDENIEIKIYQVIYDAIEDVRSALEGMLKPEFEEQSIGSLAVKQIFKMKKIGTIAGCYVERGVVQKNCLARIYRNDVLIQDDSLSSLKHYQNDVAEVRAGSDCGITLKSFQDIKEGDVIECFVVKQVDKKLQ